MRAIKKHKRFLTFYIAVIFLAFLSPLPATGQEELNVQVWTAPLDAEGAPQHLNYGLCNWSSSPIDVFELSGLRIYLDNSRFQVPAPPHDCLSRRTSSR